MLLPGKWPTFNNCGKNLFSDHGNQSETTNAINSFWRSFNIFYTDFKYVSSDVKCVLFKQYCCSFIGSQLWD